VPDDVRARTAANRLVLADLFAGLTGEQLATPSLCAGWSCREVLGHLVTPLQVGFARFLAEVARDRGRAGVTSDRLARTLAARPVDDLVRVLRDRSGAALSPPGVGPSGPFADSCIHLRDVAVPLGLATSAPPGDWVRVLGFLGTPRARAAGFVPRGRLDGLRLVATDLPWTSGSGAEVTGPAEALALAVTGRSAGLDALGGDGLAVLRERVLGPRP
jgi:uncharacterized protein (TIGR03083 family)